MRFEEYLTENFNLDNAKRHSDEASKHKVGSYEHHNQMSLHHSQMFWHHQHAGRTSEAQKHFHQMNHHADQAKKAQKQ